MESAIVQPTGLVVSAPALVRAGAILDRRDAAGQELLRASLAPGPAARDPCCRLRDAVKRHRRGSLGKIGAAWEGGPLSSDGRCGHECHERDALCGAWGPR